MPEQDFAKETSASLSSSANLSPPPASSLPSRSARPGSANMCRNTENSVSSSNPRGTWKRSRRFYCRRGVTRLDSTSLTFSGVPHFSEKKKFFFFRFYQYAYHRYWKNHRNVLYRLPNLTSDREETMKNEIYHR